MPLPEDFKEFIELMIDDRVKFVMIGGYAYNLYRNPRATGDIDFLVENSLENEKRLRNVLTRFGFGGVLPGVSQRFLESGKVIMLGRSPFRIDILTSIDGVSVEDVFLTSERIEVDGIIIPTISPAMLLANKLATGRAKDIADAEELSSWLDGDGDNGKQ